MTGMKTGSGGWLTGERHLTDKMSGGMYKKTYMPLFYAQDGGWTIGKAFANIVFVPEK